MINHHARNTLTAFGKWAGLQSSSDNKNGGGFDYAVLLTRSVASVSRYFFHLSDLNKPQCSLIFVRESLKP